jgi:lipopolysaccharide transport system permease protein
VSSVTEIQSAKELPAEDRLVPPANAAEADLPVTVIERRPGWQLIDLNELWRHRELLYFLIWRDVKVRYKQTVLGAAWAILKPFATMIAFTLFLARVVELPSDLPYPLFAFAGLLPWTFFSTAVSSGGQSVVNSQNLITKVYFPRLIIPLADVGASLFDFGIAFGVLVVLMLYYGVVPGWQLVLVPGISLLLMLAAIGVGTLLAALTVAYRDFRHVVPFMIQLWMFTTPSIYMDANAVLGPRGQALLPLNPAHGLIVNFRAAMLGQPLDLYALAVSGTVSVVLVVLGCLYFRRVERSFADII